MKKRMQLVCFTVLLYGMLFGGATAMAGQDPPVLKALTGTGLHKDSSIMVEDSKFFDVNYNNLLIKPYSVKNKISFRINESANIYFSSAFNASVAIRIYKTL